MVWKPPPCAGCDSVEDDGAGISGGVGVGMLLDVAAAGSACCCWNCCCCICCNCCLILLRAVAAAAAATLLTFGAQAGIVLGLVLDLRPYARRRRRALAVANSESARDSSRQVIGVVVFVRSENAVCACWNLSCAKPRSTGA